MNVRVRRHQHAVLCPQESASVEQELHAFSPPKSPAVNAAKPSAEWPAKEKTYLREESLLLGRQSVAMRNL